MSKLHEITKEIAYLYTIECNSDEDKEAIENTLEAIEMNFDSKVENIVKLIKSFKNDQMIIENEIERLSKRKNSVKNKINSVKSYLINCMNAADKKKISRPLFSVSVVPPKKRVVIEDESKIDNMYMKVNTTVSPDKLALMRDLKMGKDVPGASLVDGENSIKIT